MDRPLRGGFRRGALDRQPVSASAQLDLRSFAERADRSGHDAEVGRRPPLRALPHLGQAVCHGRWNLKDHRGHCGARPRERAEQGRQAQVAPGHSKGRLEQRCVLAHDPVRPSFRVQQARQQLGPRHLRAAFQHHGQGVSGGPAHADLVLAPAVQPHQLETLRHLLNALQRLHAPGLRGLRRGLCAGHLVGAHVHHLQRQLGHLGDGVFERQWERIRRHRVVVRGELVRPRAPHEDTGHPDIRRLPDAHVQRPRAVHPHVSGLHRHYLPLRAPAPLPHQPRGLRHGQLANRTGCHGHGDLSQHAGVPCLEDHYAEQLGQVFQRVRQPTLPPAEGCGGVDAAHPALFPGGDVWHGDLRRPRDGQRAPAHGLRAFEHYGALVRPPRPFHARAGGAQSDHRSPVGGIAGRHALVGAKPGHGACGARVPHDSRPVQEQVGAEHFGRLQSFPGGGVAPGRREEA
mmetsp:Transcript_51921/g.145792  ORF Transcript_51921/g.145792 Transcript_51921/m.145792 type:complete len:459 (-) Transcript_51921:1073-2449(-)